MQDMLFLSQRIPFPPNKGDKIRSFNILKHFSQTHRIHLGCFIDDPVDWEYVPELQKLCADMHIAPLNQLTGRILSIRALFSGAPLNIPYFYNRALSEWTQNVFSQVKPKVAFAFSSQMAQYFLNPAVRAEQVIVDYCDVDSDKWLQYAKSKKWPLNWVFEREGRTLLQFDRRVGKEIDAGTFVTAQEVELFHRLAPETVGKIHAIGNGIDAEYFSPEGEYPSPFESDAPVVIFTGAMDYWPNVDAVNWFATELFPRVRESVAGLQFHIVGGNPTTEVLRLERIDGVTVTGRVPDMRPYFVHSRAAVTPMRIARGIQNKVLEAMAMGKPTVTTPQSLEGIEAIPGRDLLLAESPDEFVKHTITALTDPMAMKLGENARKLITSSYAWDAQLAAFDVLIGNNDASSRANSN
jgi:sugar transferase (PEP-CTERM/EpsH1 system associated)